MKKLISMLLILAGISINGWSQLSTSSLPIIVINTTSAIPDEPKVEGSIGIIWDSNGGINSINDPFNHYSGAIGIEVRGNSSQMFDKKPYTFQLRNGSQEPVESSLLGLPADDKWILHATYIDKSLLRVALSFDVFSKMGHYCSRYRYVELVVNNNYKGVYLLVEKIEQGSERVDIQTNDGTQTGSILRIDWDGGAGFKSEYNSIGEQKLLLQYEYPKKSQLTLSQQDQLKQEVHAFEEGLFAPNFINSQNQRYSELLDLESFADFFIINELAKNSDGYKLSTFIHKDVGGKFKAGPIWDFDQTYGLSTVCSGNDPCGWLFLQNQEACEDLMNMPAWWERLNADTVFGNLVLQKWNNYRSSFLHTDTILSWIDHQAQEIALPQDRNFQRWPILGTAVWFETEPLAQTYQEEVERLKSWIVKRLNWIDNNILGLKEFSSAKNKVKLYPNPSDGEVSIAAPTGGSVRICNMMGQEVWSRADCQTSSMQIDVSSWNVGTYIVYVKTFRGVFAEKLVVR